MKRFIVYAHDGREFRVTAWSPKWARIQVINATMGRVTIVGIRELH